MLVLLILVFATLAFLAYKFDLDYEGFFVGAFIMISIVAFIALAVVGITFSTSMTIDKKIAMYQLENDGIQNEISSIVESYKTYEKDTFKDFKTQSPVTLVTIYPELKANELVTKQIEVYLANNQTIKSLKEEKIDQQVYAWWVYFNIGGKG